MAHHSASLIESGRLTLSRGRAQGLSIRRVGRSVLAALILFAVGGCASQHQMGTPIRADRPTNSSPGTAAPPESPVASSVSPDLKQWDVVWAKIEVDPMTGNWVDHLCARNSSLPM
jgi:hypothetical protein